MDEQAPPRRHIAGMTGQFESLEAYMVYHRKGRLERIPRGEKHANAKLTEVQVAEIRRSYYAGEKDCCILGQEYGVSSSSIENIINGVTWANGEVAISNEKLVAIKKDRKSRNVAKATDATRKLTEDAVRAIRAEYVPKKVSMDKLAEKYGVSQSAISEVITRKSWTHI
ncbi:helix-turn-helix domain-containing protein [Paenibacillus sinopodophylli]|uniref:helix-turn-helix domain-containing protein n=1 Tax=Paenibacillus sinopodophylli TaxID=1837342 RepID=UPI0014861D59|nr:helix-turn-helix domain-containing protein [Paenibacillus sinopodophylli]